MIQDHKYDVIVAGGGLAGLSISILLAKAGYRVALFEKEKFPFHKVCGEYISLESWNFLEELGLPLSDWNLPVIKKLIVSAPGGNFIEHELPLGGFGISRYRMDAALAQIAKSSGVALFENCKITDIGFDKSGFGVVATGGRYRAKLVCGSFGKRSNIDIKWKRKFTRTKNDKLNNYIGIKYHVKLDFPPDTIALHNFKDGYCGISKIEDDKYCLCYLTSAENLRRCNNSISDLEQKVLCKNPFLDRIFSEAVFLYTEPETISQISFEKKTQVQEHVLLCGDAAGMITPLCGNGMSMALHGAKIAFQCMDRYFQQGIERHEMEQEYTDLWNRQFGGRLLAGRIIQRFFGSESLSNFMVKSLKPFPRIISFLIRKTHGQPF